MSAICSDGSETETEIKTMKLYSHVDRVYNELKELGYGPQDPLKVMDVCSFDQYHYHGTVAVDTAIDMLKLNSSHRLLDIGSGLGGPARYIAYKTGAHVTAVELQQDLNDVAADLTKRCGLQDKVECACGDILKDEYGLASFDVIVSWLTFLHIPAKHELFEKCYAHLKPGGKMYIADYFSKSPFTREEVELLKTAVYCSDLSTEQTYKKELENAGFTNIQFLDRTDSWSEFVHQRLLNYRDSKDRHIRVHGEEVYKEQNYFYTTVDQLFKGGNLGGCKVIAEKK